MIGTGTNLDEVSLQKLANELVGICAAQGVAIVDVDAVPGDDRSGISNMLMHMCTHIHSPVGNLE